MIPEDQIRRIIARKGRPISESEMDPLPEFRTELHEFDPEVYSQNPFSEDGDLEISGD